MDLNLFENFKKDMESHSMIKNFINELSNFLNNLNSFKTQNNQNDISNPKDIKEKEQCSNVILEEDKKLQDNRKEGHLYLVTEDRNNEIYLWDFTDKSKHEFKETILSKELLSVAKEGAMLQYKNGKYELYSSYGYDMLLSKKNNGKTEK